MTIYTINLERVSGTNNLPITMLTRISDEIARRVDDDPSVALFYVCDHELPIPSQREGRTERFAEYRDRLFGALFRRTKNRLGLYWRDHTVDIGRLDDPNRTSAHIIIHETKFNAARTIEQKVREYTADK